MRSECNRDAMIFIQLPCLIPSDKIVWRKILALFIGCFGCFIYFFVQVYAHYIEQVEDNRFIEWDVATITAADYTVEFDIDPE